MKRKYSEDYTTAFHEAAHAVVRIALGLSVKYIEIYDPSNLEQMGYMATFGGDLFMWDAPADMIATLASIPAEQLLDPSNTKTQLMYGTCEQDYNDADILCRKLLPEEKYVDRLKVVDEAVVVAGVLVRELAKTIHRVARCLEKKRKMGYLEILELIPEDVKEDGIDGRIKRFKAFQAAA